MSDAEPITLPVHCIRCKRAVALTYTPGLVAQRQDWVCPYEGCWMLQNVELSGHDVSAVARYEPQE